MTERQPAQGTLPAELIPLRDAVGDAARTPEALADMAIDGIMAGHGVNAQGEIDIRPDDDAAQEALTDRLDAILDMGATGRLGPALRARIDVLVAASSSAAGLSPDQRRQAAAINALVNRNQAAAISGAANAAAVNAAAGWGSRQRARARRAQAAAAAAAPPVQPGPQVPPGQAPWRIRNQARQGRPPVPAPAPAAANRTRDDYDTLTKRWKFLVDRAQAANAQKQNGHEKERNLSMDELQLREILRALDVNPEVELPMTGDRRHPEQGMNESIEDSLDFLVEARELYLQLRDRPIFTKDQEAFLAGNQTAQLDPFQYKGPGIARGKGDEIRAELVDRLGILTDFSRWTVDAAQRDTLKGVLEELYIADITHELKDGRGGVREPLTRLFEAAGQSRNQRATAADPIFRSSRAGIGGAVSNDGKHEMWNLDSHLIVFHRAQILKRMRLSNELMVTGYRSRIERHIIGQGYSGFDVALQMAPYQNDIENYMDRIDRAYADWMFHLYDGIDPRDGTRRMHGGPAYYGGFNRAPVTPRYHHQVFPQAGAIAVGSMLQSHHYGMPGQSRHTPGSKRHLHGGFGHSTNLAKPVGTPSVKPNAQPDPDDKLPSERTKERINALYRADLARRKAERRKERKDELRRRVANLMVGTMLAMPEPVQARMASAARRSTAKRRAAAVPGQKQS